ncbi:hypothetical protein [Staphylococcus pettenkoferi]|uniref:hypothetical protein n=1 Tax=Staphylococcus pettenkoferi TaxID=170573 RepID=UPI0011A39E96|nr:hypothetical protein [Staphylococcus pettenkoferi]MCI2803689.1 hypothetical protein [Staphylococcus pettenkoferi]MCY1574604.1 hypothetical protein [Staphylococcus pettenkoferi]MCY1578074.1 hypothetical protein [Staphylococcus pettenkoferi]MCY1585535.1 hypothetical protein [Staphylococcus pettenkoferi]MCY1615150.1 hypothetical protein [Staphylococcus pettenkoferi]
MEFTVVKSSQEPLYREALSLYDEKLDISLYEDEQIFKQSLENQYTKDDYIFLVGLEEGEVVSLATAHYEATTNSSFLIYLIARNTDNHDTLMDLTLEEVKSEINKLANRVHERDVNFIMFEVPKEPEELDDETDQIIRDRQTFLNRHGFEKQHEIPYLRPDFDGTSPGIPKDLYIKPNLELTKDIYGTSVKSNYILKYVFANKLSRSYIYSLLEAMNLRKASHSS